MKKTGRTLAAVGMAIAGAACVVTGGVLVPVVGAAVGKAVSTMAAAQAAVAAAAIKEQGKK